METNNCKYTVETSGKDLFNLYLVRLNTWSDLNIWSDLDTWSDLNTWSDLLVSNIFRHSEFKFQDIRLENLVAGDGGIDGASDTFSEHFFHEDVLSSNFEDNL